MSIYLQDEFCWKRRFQYWVCLNLFHSMFKSLSGRVLTILSYWNFYFWLNLSFFISFKSLSGRVHVYKVTRISIVTIFIGIFIFVIYEGSDCHSKRILFCYFSRRLMFGDLISFPTLGPIKTRKVDENWRTNLEKLRNTTSHTWNLKW